MMPDQTKPGLLLHACCAPCATIPLERLRSRFQVAVFFFGPNIHPREEYTLRLQDMRRLCRHMQTELVEAPYRPSSWGHAILPFRRLPEGSERCEACFRLRMTETARCAKARGIRYFTVTLTVARQKKTAQVNRVGLEVARSEGVEFLAEDFKKQAGFDLSVLRSRELSLRRQDYCGCALSRARAVRGRSVRNGGAP